MEIETSKMKRQSCNNHNNAKQAVMEDLPKPIMAQILLKLPSKSLFCLECVSKALLNTIEDQCFITQQNRLLSDNEAPVEVPQLMSIAHTAEKGSSTFCCTLQPVKCVRRSLKTGKYKLKVSSRGLCFVFRNLFGFKVEFPYKNEEEVCFIVNPLKRREVVELPTRTNYQQLTEPSNPKLFNCFYGMGVDKNTYKLKIVRVGEFRSQKQEFVRVAHVLDMDSAAASWREISSVLPDDFGSSKIFDFKELGVSACNDVHWFTQIEGRGCILSFDFTTEEFSWTPMPPGLDLSRKLHLLTFRGSLALSATRRSPGKSNIEIWVLKDYERILWKLEYAVDVDTFCESYLLEMATCGEWEHGIYFYYHRKSTFVGKFFVDLRSTPVKCFSPTLGRVYTYVVSYTGSLLSLKNYDNFENVSDWFLD